MPVVVHFMGHSRGREIHRKRDGFSERDCQQENRGDVSVLSTVGFLHFTVDMKLIFNGVFDRFNRISRTTKCSTIPKRRGGRVAEGASLEN